MTTTTGATAGVIRRRMPPGALTGRMVVANPEVHLKAFINHWLKHLPDLSEGKKYHHTDLQFWKNWKHKGRKDERSAHRWLKGLLRTYTVLAADFCISQNMWPVVFEREDISYDMTLGFILAFWACYINCMANRPDCTTAVATTVLKYLLTNKPLVVRTWRSRLYFYGSATIFRKVQLPLVQWTEDEHGITLPRYNTTCLACDTNHASPAIHNACLACDTTHVSPATQHMFRLRHNTCFACDTTHVFPAIHNTCLACGAFCFVCDTCCFAGERTIQYVYVYYLE